MIYSKLFLFFLIYLIFCCIWAFPYFEQKEKKWILLAFFFISILMLKLEGADVRFLPFIYFFICVFMTFAMFAFAIISLKYDKSNGAPELFNIYFNEFKKTDALFRARIIESYIVFFMYIFIPAFLQEIDLSFVGSAFIQYYKVGLLFNKSIFICAWDFILFISGIYASRYAVIGKKYAIKISKNASDHFYLFNCDVLSDWRNNVEPIHKNFLKDGYIEKHHYADFIKAYTDLNYKCGEVEKFFLKRDYFIILAATLLVSMSFYVLVGPFINYYSAAGAIEIAPLVSIFCPLYFFIHFLLIFLINIKNYYKIKNLTLNHITLYRYMFETCDTLFKQNIKKNGSL